MPTRPVGLPESPDYSNSDNELEGNRYDRREPGIRVDVLGLDGETTYRGKDI